jgi:hypothetical protein
MTDQTEDWLDEDGYPTDAALKRIAVWPWNDLITMLEFARSLWRWPQFWEQENDTLSITTGGWSGNESIAKAMQQNFGFWNGCWYRSTRGGLYEFDLTRARALADKTKAA